MCWYVYIFLFFSYPLFPRCWIQQDWCLALPSREGKQQDKWKGKQQCKQQGKQQCKQQCKQQGKCLAADYNILLNPLTNSTESYSNPKILPVIPCIYF